MVQAARSGKQNIVEASSERTSKKIELKLLGISRGSLQELLEDYEDFLRQRGLKQWTKDSHEARVVRNLAYQPDKSDRSYQSYRSDLSYQSYKSYLSDPTSAANAMICVINQANFLLDRQIKTLEQKFIKEGGWGEQLRKKRVEELKQRLRWF